MNRNRPKGNHKHLTLSDRIRIEQGLGLGETFRKIAGEICRALRASKKAPGAERIYTAGEKEYLVWLDRKEKGVPVGEAVQREILEVRDKLNLPYHFPFEQ